MIDRDRAYLLKEAQKTLSESDTTAQFCLCQRWILKDTIALLKEQPEIVMCGDCKYFNNHPMTHGLHYGECDNGMGMVNHDWFCADGERKREDG